MIESIIGLLLIGAILLLTLAFLFFDEDGRYK